MIPVLLIFIPLLAGIVSFFLKNGHAARTWALLASLATLAVSLLGLTALNSPGYLVHQSEWIQPLGSSFYLKLDGMGQLLCLLTAVAYPLILVGSWQNEYKKAHHYYGLLLLAQAGLMGVFLSMDALLFYFFWELALIPAYFLSSQWGGEKRIRVTFKFFVYTFVGSLLMLVGIIYLQSKTDGSFSIEAFRHAVLSPREQDWLFWVFFVAFAIKMPVFPFHTWQPDAYEQAPTTTTAVLSGIMVKMGLLGVLRWLIPVIASGSYVWSNAVPPLALVGLIYASLIAIRQDDIKRLVAYSSIAHIGLMCAAAFTYSEYGLQGVMFQMFAHGINIIGMWLLVDIIERKYGTRKMSELGGVAQQSPALVIFFVIIALANIALPLTNAFVGEFIMFNGLAQAKSAYGIYWVVMAGMGVILGAVYTLNMIRRIFYGEMSERVTTAGSWDLSLNQKLALGIIVVLTLWMGIYPQSVLNVTESLSHGIINKVIGK